MGYSVGYMGNSVYDNSKMDMLLSKYPMINKQWKYVGSSDTIRWSLGDVVKNMYIGNGGNLVNNNGMTNEGYINGAVMRRGV